MPHLCRIRTDADHNFFLQQLMQFLKSCAKFTSFLVTSKLSLLYFEDWFTPKPKVSYNCLLMAVH